MSLYLYDPSALHKRFKRIIRQNEANKDNLQLYLYDPSALHKRFKRILRQQQQGAARNESGANKSNKKKQAKRNDWPLVEGSFKPLVDIFENEKGFIIQAELPGIKKEDITLDVQDGVLTLEAERAFVYDEETEVVHRVERAYGKIKRLFTLPENADINAIQASFNHGVLEVTVPSRHNKPIPQRITIQ
eukprot:TRINITY_DN3621_c0_g1_i1.p1 TRINITY_DN3621_c0_g1~~TRINITY_DN3621_c0_g1_i1.p1  ORF type:complete len:189 (+),score=47.40 TRINITY_DN3621_c0_g1_i1:198-764(+)